MVEVKPKVVVDQTHCPFDCTPALFSLRTMVHLRELAMEVGVHVERVFGRLLTGFCSLPENLAKLNRFLSARFLSSLFGWNHCSPSLLGMVGQLGRELSECLEGFGPRGVASF